MRKLSGVLVLVLATALVPSAAFAELGESTPCMACPAIAHITSCNEPIPGAQVLRGSVTGFLKGKCSLFMKFWPVAAARKGLPPRIPINLGPCAVWSGRTNSVVSIAVAPTPRFDEPEYALACRHW